MYKYPIIAILTILLLTFSACREITVKTTVHKDGSFTRVIKITGDSSSVMKKDLPYPVDETWSVELITKKDIDKLKMANPEWSITQDTLLEDDLHLTYSKTYENSDLLNNEIRGDTGWRKELNRTVTIDKRFGFFYSYVTFKEVYTAANPFNELDIKDFLSPEDIKILTLETIPQSEADSLIYEEVEERAFDFLEHAITYELLATLEKGIREVNSKSLNAINLDAYSDSIAQKLESVDFETLSDFIGLFEEWTANAEFQKLNSIDPPLFEELDKDWSFLIHVVEMHGFLQQVEMPGLITSTNSAEIIGNQVSWNVEGLPMILTDYVMTAESRVVNYWAFILSGIVLLLLIILLVVKAFRK